MFDRWGKALLNHTPHHIGKNLLVFRVLGVEDIDTRSFDCRESDANTKDAKGAASKASDTASGNLFYLFITQLFVRSWIVIMAIFGSELWVSRVSMGSIHFLFSGTEAAIAAVLKLEFGEETKLSMYYYLGFCFCYWIN
jgi:hypothetical protein